MKKLLAMLLVIVMTLSLFAGCGSNETVSTEPDAQETQAEVSGEELGLVGFSSVSLSESIYVLEEEALKAIFAGKAEVQTVSCDNDAATQIQQIKNFALMGADLIVINPADIDALADAIKEAHDAGCKIYINGATTDTLSEEYYECCTVSDEYLCGAYVAMIAKNWIEAHEDELNAANPDWEIAFLESSLSDETLKRTYGIESILDPYLKDWEGNYVDASGNIVDEANKVKNPAYCQIAVDHFAGVKVEMDQTNSSLNIANILTTNPNTRVFMAFNSLASTQGAQYIVDNYPDKLDEFAFFSAGVMGNEADYIVGSVSDTEGVKSIMRGAVQFGVSAAGSDVAASVANTAYAIVYGEEGVDYTKKNPDGIAAWWAVEEEWSPDGVASVTHFNILSGATVQAFDPIATLDDENTVYYWNSKDGFIVEEEEETPVEEQPVSDAPATVGAAVTAGDYIFMETIPTGEEIQWTVTLKEDGTAFIIQANEGMGNPSWDAVWTDNGDGTFTTSECVGSSVMIADFWEETSITWQMLNDNMTVPVLYSEYDDMVAEYGIPAAGGATVAAGEYIFMETIPTGEEIQWTVTLNEDGTAFIIQANEGMGNPSWDAVWTDNGNGTFTTGECVGSSIMIADFWDNNSITWTDNGDGTATPVGYVE